MPICLMVPDLISYATQFWRAAEVLPLMWHSLLLKIIGFSLPPLSLTRCVSLSLKQTQTFCPCSLWACSVNRPLARQCWCRVPVPLGGFQAAFQQSGAQLVSKKTDLSIPGSVLRDVTSTWVRGHSAGWSGACQ